MERSETVVHRPRPRGRFAYFAAMGKVGRRPQTAKLSRSLWSLRLKAYSAFRLFYVNLERIPPRHTVVNYPRRQAAAGTRLF